VVAVFALVEKTYVRGAQKEDVAAPEVKLD